MNGPELLTYDMGADVCAFSTTRLGGYSEGNYSSFNANAFCGDSPAAVQRNRELLCKSLHVEQSRLVMPHQTHGMTTRIIDEDFLLLNDSDRAVVLEGVDAVMTNLPKVCVAVSTADCIPILIYDRACHAVAAVHAGWRGTLQRIAQAALRDMTAAFGTQPGEVRVAIGPGISLEAFEVGDEVYDAFLAAHFPMEKLARRYPSSRAGQSKWHIDLWQTNTMLLEECGVPRGNIHVAGICTYTHVERFFSARRLGVHSGRILNGIFLTN